MAKHGVSFKPEQIVSLLRQIEVLSANGKTLEEACKSLSITVQSYYHCVFQPSVTAHSSNMTGHSK